MAIIDSEQVKLLVQNYFFEKPSRAENFLKELESNKCYQNLINSPLLIKLLCELYTYNFKLPTNPWEICCEIYDSPLNSHLSSWNDNIFIENDSFYKEMSYTKKRMLLSEIAFSLFKQNKTLFKYSDIENSIYCFMSAISPTCYRTNDFIKEVCIATFRAIIIHHKLILQIDNQYCLIDTTFMEYFAAEYIMHKIPKGEGIKIIEDNIADKKWSLVILIVAELLSKCDDIAILIKNKIDYFVNQDEYIKKFVLGIKSTGVYIQNEWKFSDAQLLVAQNYLRLNSMLKALCYYDSFYMSLFSRNLIKNYSFYIETVPPEIKSDERFIASFW